MVVHSNQVASLISRNMCISIAKNIALYICQWQRATQVTNPYSIVEFCTCIKQVQTTTYQSADSCFWKSWNVNMTKSIGRRHACWQLIKANSLSLKPRLTITNEYIYSTAHLYHDNLNLGRLTVASRINWRAQISLWRQIIDCWIF